MAKTLTLAGAGSGKTYTVEHEAAQKLLSGEVSPAKLMVVTFTKKAAAELKERITGHLLQRGEYDLAASLEEARLGTINSVCGEMVQSFCFELGLSPRQRVIDDPEPERLLAEALDSCLSVHEVNTLNRLARRFSMDSWHSQVLNIVKQARLNKVDVQSLTLSGRNSVAGLSAVLPESVSSITETQLMATLRTALSDAELYSGATDKLLTSIGKMKKILHLPEPSWENWIQLFKLDSGVKERYLLEDIKAFAGKVLVCPAFHAELQELIILLFDSASKAMTKYAEIKAERGLVDFVDQELLLLNALDNSRVIDRLREEIDLLVVDEFQDTSPIQLALFAKLSDLANETLFVGDTKQAIYGFRGTDSTLSLSVLEYFQAGAGDVHSLDSSWRSRPGLVHFTNALFVQPFSSILRADQVTLTPKRVDKTDSPELGWWRVSGKNKSLRASALAYGIEQLLDSPPQIEDKTTGGLRAVGCKDIAVLCRGHNEIAEIATALVNLGIPVASSRAGLLETPEASLVLACFRRLVDPLDSLASAEIITLVTGQNPEYWLEGRLKAVEVDTKLWNDCSHPVLEKLATMRNKVAALSIAETLSMAINGSGILEIIVSWGEAKRLTDHRLANIQRLADFVSDYEDHCSASGEPGTPAGYILWLRSQEQSFTDAQAENPGDAVKLITYHGSKGLEWPVVICSSLDSAMKVSLYGVRIYNNSASFDWDDPLQGREVRFWPDPFPNQKGRDPLTDILKNTPEWQQAESIEWQERLQLLYVGLTRARDHLVLTNQGNKRLGQWLQQLKSDLLPLDNECLSLPSGVTVGVDIKELEASDNVNTDVKRERFWPETLSPENTDSDFYHEQPSAALPCMAVTTCVVEDFNQRIKVSGSAPMDEVGNAIHHSLALLFSKPDMDEESVQKLVDSYVPGELSASSIISQFNLLQQWISKDFPKAQVMTEVPLVRNLANGALQRGRIDLLLKLDNGYVIIDHKSNPQPKNCWEEIAQKYSGQLKSYSDALLEITEKPALKCFIFFAVSGGLVEVGWE